MDQSSTVLSERLSQLAQDIGLLERKTDFILKALNLTYIDDPGASIPPELAEVYALVRQGKKIQAIQEYRKQTGAGLGQAKSAVDKLEAGFPSG